MPHSEKLEFDTPRHLAQLYCSDEKNLTKIESQWGVRIATRDNWLNIDGDKAGVLAAKRLFELLQKAKSQGMAVSQSDFDSILHAIAHNEEAKLHAIFENPLVIKVKQTSIVPKTVNQKRYLEFIAKYDVVFGIGPAGTGKTFLAVVRALQALVEGKINKVIITRPAVEAGEALGFLPGDLQEKILPYLRPLYDAMDEIIGREDSMRLMEKGVIEIAPLAYMRGRTLSNAYVLLDEAQNTTPEQMMMFLTRLGENSRMIITGDITQVDLPKAKASGLKQAVQALSKIKGIKFFYFDEGDVVRHTLVRDIIKAYDHYFTENAPRQKVH
ncbi:MAG TPA: phosphate starvation-inducible protein PhoH [Opitutae bacterium]|nr:phosphate starvation-inducible protein PhoH [Opitutae bacterium]|tara:strand:+ start:920 stop:1900 length:981 start_codon:yes stop_codon:yes gene_type:complete